METMKMKKIMNAVLFCMFIIIFAGCGGSDSSSNDESSTTTTTTTIPDTTSTTTVTVTSTSDTTSTTLASNQPATAVGVSTTPNNPSTVPAGVYCTHTTSIVGAYTITDPDGETVVTIEWFDNDQLRKTNTETISASGTTNGTSILPAPFSYHHTIKFKVTADGVVSNETSALIT
jgi:hypothetical protein